MQSSQGSTLVARATQAHQPPAVAPRPTVPPRPAPTTQPRTVAAAQPAIAAIPTPPPVAARPTPAPRPVVAVQPANPQTQGVIRVALPPPPAQRQPLVPTRLQPEIIIDPVQFDAVKNEALTFLNKARDIIIQRDAALAEAQAEKAEAQAEKAEAQAEKAKMAYLKPRIQELTEKVLLAFGSIFQIADIEAIKRFSPEQNPIAMSKPDYLLKLKGPNGSRDFYCDPYDPVNIKYYLKNMSQIIAFLDANPNVRSCDFRRIKGIESGIAQFAEKLKTSSVSSVNFGNIEISDADLRALASVKQSNSRTTFSFDHQSTATRFRQISS